MRRALAAVAAVGLLAGCGGSSEADGPKKAGPTLAAADQAVCASQSSDEDLVEIREEYAAGTSVEGAHALDVTDRAVSTLIGLQNQAADQDLKLLFAGATDSVAQVNFAAPVNGQVEGEVLTSAAGDVQAISDWCADHGA